MTETIEFKPFPKIPRLSRECIITEKIDGTNASIYIGENGEFLTGSRNRWITVENDNFGFAKWAQDNKECLMELGVGHHFGEWWGVGINRGYGLSERRFSLFNVSKWVKFTGDPILKDGQSYCPECCHVVPVLYEGMFDTGLIESMIGELILRGSMAVDGYMKPEGIVIYHKAANQLFKKTIENDEQHKSEIVKE